MRSSPSSVASSWWEVVSGAEVGAHMRRRWFCVGAKPGALLTRGCTACTPAATCPAIIQAPLSRTVPRDSLAPGEAFFDQRWAWATLWSQTRLALCRLFTGGAIASLDKDEPVTWMQHEDLCFDPSVRWLHGSRRSG
jgi:hypothetical protein